MKSFPLNGKPLATHFRDFSGGVVRVRHGRVEIFADDKKDTAESVKKANGGVVPRKTPLPVVTTSTQPAKSGDVALTGPDGKAVTALLAHAEKEGADIFAQMAQKAIKRLLREPQKALGAVELFTPEEQVELADKIAATNATANMLGRSRVRLRQQRAEAMLDQFDETETTRFSDAFGPTKFASGPSTPPPIKPLAPTAAIAWFKRKVPTVRVNVHQFTQEQRDKAFWLARQTDARVLSKIKEIIYKVLATGQGASDAPHLIQTVLDKTGLAPNNPQYACFLPGTVVEGNVLAASQARYCGPAVEIETDDGRRLRVTVNHPILTPSGWKHAGQVKEGDNLICYGDSVETLNTARAILHGIEQTDATISDSSSAIGILPLVASPAKRRAIHDEDVPARIEDVFQAILGESPSCLDCKRPVSPLDFHGDAAFFNGNVHCVGTNGVLGGHQYSGRFQTSDEFTVIDRNVTTARPSGHAIGVFDLRIDGGFRADTGADEWLEPLHSSVAIPFRPIHTHALGLSTDADACLAEMSHEGFEGDVQRHGDVISHFPTLIPGDGRGKIKLGFLPASDTESDIAVADRFGRWTELVPGQAKRFGTAANLDPGAFKSCDKSVGGDAKLASDLCQGLPGVVETHCVVSVKRFTWTGHVYDLQTETGFIVSDGIVTSNSMVFRTNLMEAYRAGEQEERNKPEVQETFPVWKYLGIDDGREGDDHRPHFDQYYPSNVPFEKIRNMYVVRGGRVVTDPTGKGRPYNCRCVAQEISKYRWGKLKQAGARIAAGFDDPTEILEALPVEPPAKFAESLDDLVACGVSPALAKDIDIPPDGEVSRSAFDYSESRGEAIRCQHCKHFQPEQVERLGTCGLYECLRVRDDRRYNLLPDVGAHMWCRAFEQKRETPEARNADEADYLRDQARQFWEHRERERANKFAEQNMAESLAPAMHKLADVIERHHQPQPAPVVNVAAPIINVPQPIVNVAAPEVKVAAPDVHVASPVVNIQPPKVQVKVEAARAPDVRVTVPPIKIPAPKVTVRPQIEVNPKVEIPPRKTTKEVQYDSSDRIMRVTETEQDA